MKNEVLSYLEKKEFILIVFIQLNTVGKKNFDFFVEVHYDIFKILSPKNIRKRLPPLTQNLLRQNLLLNYYHWDFV